MVLFLVLINIFVWIACAVVLHFHISLVSTAVLAYTLGLRHALDADHIAAIDLCTRRLVASGQHPVTVGTFFSSGHSTIVLVTSIGTGDSQGAQLQFTMTIVPIIASLNSLCARATAWPS